MKKILFFLTLFFLPLSAHAENRIVGKWKDKTNTTYQYEFKKGQDFIFTRTFSSGKNSVMKGVWEIGKWTRTLLNGSKQSCNLRIYAGTDECCFEYKFFAGYLIMSNRYKSNYQDFEGMCENRVLIQVKEEE
jgi:hypothetical protein